MECQLTGLAGFDDLLDKSQSETDMHDAGADDLTRRRSNKRKKRNLSNKPPSVIADVRPSGSAGDSATARLWIFLFCLFAVRACACLGERSEPTCIRQAHVTVPKGEFFLQLEVEKSSKNKLLTIRGLDVILYTESGFNQA